MERTPILRAALLAAALAASACSGGSGSAGDGGAPPATTTLARDDYATRLAGWLCDDLAACCDASGQAFDREACVATKRAAELRRVAREEERSGRAFDEAMAATCAARLDETAPSCGHERRVPECFRTYDGVVEPGEACTSKIQCRGSLRGDVACVDGRCTERLAAGEACTDRPSDPGRCDVCRPDARCRAAADGRQLCFAYERRRGVAGDPCLSEPILPADPTTPAVLADCRREDGLYCSLDGVCTPFSPLGGSCRFDSHCGPDARCADGTCAPGRAAGEECRGLNQCGPGLYCRWTEYVCTDPGPGPGQCSGHELISGECAAPAAEGEACGRFVDCVDGSFCTSHSDANDGVCQREPDACTAGLARLQRQSQVLQLQP